MPQTLPPSMIHEEKERERMGIELNEQRGEKNEYYTTCCWVLLCFCEDSAMVFYFFFFFFLSERVRVTVWAGASLSLTCVREASKRQLPVN